MTKYRTLAASIALGVLGATLVGAAPASAGQVPQVTVTPGTAWAGQEVTISGEGCLVNGSSGGVMIEVTLQSDDDSGPTSTIPWGTEADGSWSARYNVPGTLPTGVYDIEATCYESSGTTFPPQLIPVFDYAPAALEVIAEPARGAVTATIDPTSGPIGTTISVSGSGCPGVRIAVALLAGTSVENATAQIDHVIVDPATDGTWSAELTVYDTMVGGDATVVGGDYVVTARCDYYDGEHVFAEPVAFDVTAEGEAPPPSEVQPSFLEPQALPAAPVAGTPAYTG